MRGWQTSYSIKYSRWGRLKLLSSPGGLERIYLCAKSMSMTISLDQQIKFFVEFGAMMAKEFEMSMIVELTFFLGLKSSNLEMEFLSAKPST
jgi:hypothetical protein